MDDYRKMSYWLEGTPYTENSPFEGSVTVDVAIVGGGFTGLSSAYYLKQAYPDLSIALLEKEVIGYGASGRNGGFSMPLLGWDISYLLWAFRDRGVRAHQFMLECVRRTKELVDREQLNCDLEYNGLLVLARNDHQLRQLEHELKDHRRAGCEEPALLTGRDFEERLNSAWHVGGLYDSECAILNPAKLCRELKRVIQDRGVAVYERSPVMSIRPGNTVRIEVENGTVSARFAVLALNAYGRQLGVQSNKLVPLHTHIILTEPLSENLYDEIGWTRREGIEDKRQLVHYMRLTADNRILLGGRDIAYYYGGKLYGKERHQPIFEGLESDLKGMFPMLRDTRITHRWGGPVAVTPLMVPTFGYWRGQKNITYGTGYCGHGVALSTSAGVIIRDLLMKPEADVLRELLFVNNNPWVWPPEPLMYPVVAVVRGALTAYDRWVERNAKGS